MQNQLLTGSPVLSMLRFSLPVFFGSVLSQALSFLDSLLLARMAGVSAFASVSASGAALMPVLGLGMGLVAGGIIPLTIRFGEGRPDGIRACAAGARALTGLSSAALLAVAELCVLPLLRLTGTPEDILPGAARFCRVALLGLPFSAFAALNTGILRASGNARAAARYQVLAGLVNLPADALFLALGAGETGAAAGGVLSQVIAAALSRRAVMAHPLFAERVRVQKADLLRALRTALPVCLQFTMGSLSGMAFQSMVNARGSLAVASVAAAERTLGLIALPARTTFGAVEVFAAHNLGAGQTGRARKGIRDMGLLLLTAGLPAAAAACLTGEAIARSFLPVSSPILPAYLAVNALFLPFEFLCGVLRNALQGLGKPGLAAISGAVELLSRLCIALFFRSSGRMLLYVQPAGITLCLFGPLAAYLSLISDSAPSGTGHPRAQARRIPAAPAPLRRRGALP